jgi:NAD(P)-dependent dehydrogenase (short-subunit alcohol dehydrogenase family)
MTTRVVVDGRVVGKIAYVTGAARGLGLAIAQTLIEQGATVFIGDRDADGVAQAGALIGAAEAFHHDVVRREEWQRHLAVIIERCGRLDVLVNNAGIAQCSGANDIENVTPEGWNQVVEVNGLGTLLGCQAALAAMHETGGSIVNLSSIAALTPTPTIAAYGFSKAGVAHLTRSAAEIGAPRRIRCNSVHPGMVRTAMLEQLEAYHLVDAGSGAEKAREAFRSGIPMGEYQPERDIALGVLYLASDEARFVTGSQLVIDGGMTL